MTLLQRNEFDKKQTPTVGDLEQFLIPHILGTLPDRITGMLLPVNHDTITLSSIIIHLFRTHLPSTEEGRQRLLNELSLPKIPPSDQILDTLHNWKQCVDVLETAGKLVEYSRLANGLRTIPGHGNPKIFIAITQHELDTKDAIPMYSA
eukprot:Selendium_serpulae@DN3666_c0_g1_i2.p1